jgi:hypothetical protein
MTLLAARVLGCCALTDSLLRPPTLPLTNKPFGIIQDALKLRRRLNFHIHNLPSFRVLKSQLNRRQKHAFTFEKQIFRAVNFITENRATNT